MESIPLKSRVLELIRRAYADEQALLSALSAEERAAKGTPERWAIKDVAAHITFWKERFVKRLAARARGEAATELTDSETDEVNAEVFETYRNRTWEEIQAYSERVFGQLVAAVSQFGEQELSDPAPIGWYRNRSLLASIVGNSYTHPETHVAGVYLERGDLPRARRIQEDMADAIINVDGSAEMRGLALYNLACFYALSGEPGKAIGLLRQALPLRADLVEWSKQDSDLASLRALPEYRDLYEK